MRAELKLLLGARAATAALSLLLGLSALSVWTGLSAVRDQHALIQRLDALQADERAAIARSYAGGGDAGDAAYYTFHATWDPPSPLAFAALGQRDLQPFVLRVRMLGLQSQLYEAEAMNPELALPGPFDFAFVLVYLAPLVIIVLVHDLSSGEREAGRMRLLASLPAGGGLWRRRALLRWLLVLAALLPPLAVGLALSEASLPASAALVAVTALYAGFWVALATAFAARTRSSAASATRLVGTWVVITLLLPTLADAAIARMVPVGKGVELTLAQRQQVHAGWDAPKAQTFERFFRTHPEWRDTPPVAGRFHWKWYYAMHQAGDDAVAEQVAQYRASLRRRQRWTAIAGWVMPGVGTQVLLHRIADTDLPASLAYQDRIAAFHTDLRRHVYPYVFLERPFGRADFDALPRFAPREPGGRVLRDSLAALALAGGLALALAALELRRLRARAALA